MALLPNYVNAILDIRKIEDYCLSAGHPRGRHKARLFREVLGIDRSEAAWLRETLLEAIRSIEAVQLASDIYGSRWRVDVPVMRQGKSAVIRTVWIVRGGENAARFVTCWVL
jgi:hypothetical protein